jgi:hypothetical protein
MQLARGPYYIVRMRVNWGGEMLDYAQSLCETIETCPYQVR